ncbi:MAG: hypothetical protein AAFO04_09240 [Cyanobacteria bacterium J06592_8]
MKKIPTLITVIVLAQTYFWIGLSTALTLEFVDRTVTLDGQIAHNFDLLYSERFGELKIDLTAAKVIESFGEPQSKGEQEFWGADGLYHQKWHYPQQGIILDMAAEKEQGSATVSSVRIQAPSPLKTQRGIGIGDSSAKVKQAYGQEEDEAAPISAEYFVAGSVYGGLIFTFKDNIVTEMFLGAIAE